MAESTQVKAVEDRATAVEDEATAKKEAQDAQKEETAAILEEQVTDLQKAEGAEAMRIAKINHPEVNWQADPITGAPLVPGLSQTETFENVQYNPPPPNDTTGQASLEGQPEPAPVAEPKAKKTEDKA